MDVPIRHAVIALVIHVAVLEVFLMVFKMGIYSVVFANIIFAPCDVSVKRTCHLPGLPDTGRNIRERSSCPQYAPGSWERPLMGYTGGIYALLPDRLMRGRMGMAIVVFPSVAVAILVYAVLLVRFRAVEEEELKECREEGRLVRLLNRFRLLG